MRSAEGGALPWRARSHVAEPGQDAGGVEEMFAGHLPELLLLLELQQTHGTLDTFTCKRKSSSWHSGSSRSLLTVSIDQFSCCRI